MRREYHQWWSPALGRDMGLLEFGHAGATVLAFPTSRARFFEWEERGLVDSLRPMIDAGHFRVVCVDAVDAESWYARWKPAGDRVWRQVQYDDYLLHEVMPFAHARTDNLFVIATGASFGAYHALSFGMRHPECVQRILAMSPLVDIRLFTGDYFDENLYAVNPPDFIPDEHDPHRLHHLRSQDIILAVGDGDWLVHQNRDFSGKLWAKGIGNALRVWDGFAHDWPVWHRMLNLYVGGNA